MAQTGRIDMIKRFTLAFAFALSLASAAAAQQDPFWVGAANLRCDIETSGTCNGATCRPFNVMRVLLIDLGANQICASRDGAACGARHYEIASSDQSGRLLVVVRGTGTSYSIGADGSLAGAAVVAPSTHVFIGRCQRGGS
jgi:hypothetical protein